MPAENSILSPVSLTSFFDNATGEARQANLFFYKAGTLDPIVAYTDSTLHIPYPQPVVTTGWGRVPPVYIGEIPPPGYRVRAFDQFQTLIEDLDGLPGALPDPATVPDPTPVKPEELFHTGDIKLSWQNHQTLSGWVEITKGGTIGPIGSNASLMQSDECHDLFVHLWQQDAALNADVTLKVIGGKGASAEGDWINGTKAIEVPDVRGRFLAGLDNADTATGTPPTASLSLRMDKALFADLPNTAGTKMKPWNLGGFGGEAVHKLTKTELAVHFHDWIDSRGHTHVVHDDGHIHSASQNAHTHGITTSGAGSDNVMVRSVGGGASYSGGPNETPKDFLNGDLATTSVAPGITIANHTAGVYLVNWNATSGQVGYGTQLQYIGAFSKKPTPMPDPPVYGANDDKWHNATEVYPLPNDNSDGTDMGDRPHNTAPPFIMFAIYMKL